MYKLRVKHGRHPLFLFVPCRQPQFTDIFFSHLLIQNLSAIFKCKKPMINLFASNPFRWKGIDPINRKNNPNMYQFLSFFCG